MGIQSQNRNGSIKTMKKKGTQAKKRRTSHSRMVIGGALEFDNKKHCRLCVIYNTKGKEAAKKYKKGTSPKMSSSNEATYKRDDGVDLSFTLYLPPGYKEGEGEPLPTVMWAYPREFNDAATAGQVRDSNYRFTRVGGYSHLFFLTQGYAVLDRASMPVVGSDPETVNDTFIEQVVSNAQAAVDFTVERGFGCAGVACGSRWDYGAHARTARGAQRVERAFKTCVREQFDSGAALVFALGVVTN